VTPGKTATLMSAPSVDATVVEPGIDVAVKYNGTTVLPHLDIQFNGTGTASCQDTWKTVTRAGTETVGGVPYDIYPAPFASKSAAGNADASATGDPGTISVCADYNNRYEWSTPPIENKSFSVKPPPVTMDVATDTASKSGTCP